MRAAEASRAAEIGTLRRGHWGLSGLIGLGTEAGGGLMVLMIFMVFMMMMVMLVVMMSLPCDNLPLY